ncbi:MAG: M42 family metallopeptidase [Ignavibacteria bacterium]
MRKKSQEFLTRYLNNPSPTGFEDSGQKLWLEYIKPYVDDYISDIYGTVVGVVNPKAEYKVVIEAHADEVSWFVNYITDEGYIYLKRNGGADHQIAPSKRVNIHTEKGIVKAVFGWPAIHIRDRQKEEPPTLKNIFLDCGCESREEVEKLGIHTGCVVTFDDDMFVLNDKYIVGRALDNRLGGFAIAEVVRLLKENKRRLKFGLYVVNSVQEEIGLRGAQMIANRITPNLALITDVCHDTHSPMYEKKSEGDIKCGRGPVLTYGPSVQRNVLRLLINTAEEKKIRIQRNAVSSSTGTDTDAIAYSGMGVASALVSIPLKYMHTTVEMAHTEDVELVIKLIYEVLLRIKPFEDFRYIK